LVNFFNEKRSNQMSSFLNARVPIAWPSKTLALEESFEASRKDLLSALVLMTQDRLRSRPVADTGARKTDEFWSRIDGLIQRHETQVEKLTRSVTDLRHSLSHSKKSDVLAHKERMEKGAAQLSSLRQQIRDLEEEAGKDRRTELENEERKVRREISDIENSIGQVKNRVSSLKAGNEALKSKLKKKREEADAKFGNLPKRKREIQQLEYTLNDEMNRLKGEIEDADSELQELDDRESAVLQLCECYRKPLDVCNRMFPKSDE
jgi:chromosome segregation ATPase